MGAGADQLKTNMRFRSLAGRHFDDVSDERLDDFSEKADKMRGEGVPHDDAFLKLSGNSTPAYGSAKPKLR